METTDAVRGLACRECGARYGVEDGAGHCNQCGGLLAFEYDLDAVDARSFGPAASAPSSMWDFDGLLPVPRANAVSLGEGATPLVECRTLADELGVGRVLIKDEGGNPTGSAADRGLSLTVTAARGSSATGVALPSTGDDGHAAAAYAARAGLDANVVVPSRAGFVQKAMINVHGGDMRVVEGRLPEAEAAYHETAADREDWFPVAPFATPFRHEGRKTVLYEVVAALGETPDAMVFPTGEGAGLVAAFEASRDLDALGVIEDRPRLHAAQAAGCAPIVRAVEDGGAVEPWANPDTICATLEVPDPSAGAWVVEAIEASNGSAVATDDPAILASAVAVAEREGVSMSPGGAAAASGAGALEARGALDADDTVVLVNTAAGTKTADVLRSHLMSQGV